eukprot:3129034-Ditylum_brightwellii.AAC.1
MKPTRHMMQLSSHKDKETTTQNIKTMQTTEKKLENNKEANHDYNCHYNITKYITVTPPKKQKRKVQQGTKTT